LIGLPHTRSEVRVVINGPLHRASTWSRPLECDRSGTRVTRALGGVIDRPIELGERIDESIRSRTGPVELDCM
jgi:hypothetical protein